MNRRKKFYNATLDNSNQDQKYKDEDQDFLIFIRRVNDSLIFQWKGKTEAYLALQKEKKGHSAMISTWGGWLFSCIIEGDKMKETKIPALSWVWQGSGLVPLLKTHLSV